MLWKLNFRIFQDEIDRSLLISDRNTVVEVKIPQLDRRPVWRAQIVEAQRAPRLAVFIYFVFFCFNFICAFFKLILYVFNFICVGVPPVPCIFLFSYFVHSYFLYFFQSYMCKCFTRPLYFPIFIFCKFIFFVFLIF